MQSSRLLIVVVLLSALSAGCAEAPEPPARPAAGARQWLAGDHHVHSRYSVLWNRDVVPPEPRIGSHGVYPIPLNALMARHHGLAWMVATDHGGEDHSKLNLEQAYPNLLLAREAVPEVIQYYGVELNSPGADHASVIVPRTDEEAEQVYLLESQYDKRGSDPADTARDDEVRMLEALAAMSAFPERPIVIANHPSRTARGDSPYGLTTPRELRAWNDAAPDVAVGMIGAPGHQAISIGRDGSPKPEGRRGQYFGQPTRGGFDPMTARLGGFWDSMLGEGRRWWITANSDSHEHWTDGGVDFWPGEYSKTYVFAERTHQDILESLRAGHVFVTTGDLVSELYVTAASGRAEASIGETLVLAPDGDLSVTIRLRDPDGENHHGDRPTVRRVDLIAGEIDGRVVDAARDSNPKIYVLSRFEETDWTRDGEFLTMTYRLDSVDRPMYLRVRGTNTNELEPEPDPPGEDPWSDLWFYSNPIFLELP